MTDDDPSIGSNLVFRDAGGPGFALAHLAKEDLDPYSVDDLKQRISQLESEIKRAQGAIESKQVRRSAADALFSFKGS